MPTFFFQMATPSQANISPTTSEITKHFLMVKKAVEQSTRGDLTTLQDRMRARLAILNQEAWKGLEKGCKVWRLNTTEHHMPRSHALALVFRSNLTMEERRCAGRSMR